MRSRSVSPQVLGVLGERAVARYLKRRGYTVIAGGYRARCGEIDLIAIDHHGASWTSVLLARWRGRPLPRRTVVFVEVKTRGGDRFDTATEAVDVSKQRRIADAARVYLKANHLLEYPARFDVVAVLWPRGDRRPRSLRHYENAFPAPPALSHPYGSSRSGPVYG